VYPVWAIVVDKRGLLWLANENGIEILDPVSMQLRAVTLPFRSPFELNYVYSMCVDASGDIWATNFRGGLLRFADANPEAGTLVEPAPGCRYVNQGIDGHLWYFSSEHPRLVRKNGAAFEAGDYLQSTNPVEEIIPVEDGEGVLSGVLALLHGNRRQYFRLDPGTGRFLPGRSHTAITSFDLSDFIRYLPEKTVPYVNYPSLTNKELRVFKDRQGLIWVSTSELGIFKLKPRYLAFTTCPDLNQVSLRGLLEDADGRIYISSYNGLYIFSPSTNRARLLSNGWNAGFHLAAARSDSLLVFMDGGGMQFFHRRRGNIRRFNPAPTLTGDEGYYASLRQPDGSLLAGNRRLFRLQPEHWSVEAAGILPTDLPVRTFAFCRSKDGRTWIGTNQGVFTLSTTGICDTPALRRDYRFASPSQINDIFEDTQGRLWFATRLYGLIRYDPADQQTKTFDLNHGFASNETYSIRSSHGGQLLWISTSAGLHVLRLRDERIHIFNELDGTSNTEFNTGSCLQTRAGEFLFGGVNGLTRFHPDSLQWLDEQPQLPFIYEVNIENRRSGASLRLNYPQRDTVLHLSVDQNTLEFRFSSTDYFRSDGKTFYVQLAGLDQHWVAIGAVPHIKYYSLPAGHYTFQVKCTKDAEAAGPLVYALSFDIEAIYYKKWWFTVLLAGLALLLIWQGFQFRLRQLKREQNLRHRIASDLHDSLGAKLSGISNLVHVIGRLHQAGKPSEIESQKLLDLTRSAHGAMSDIIWAIDSSQKELSSLVRRMEDYTDKWVKAAGIKVVFEAVVHHPDKKIPFFLKHQLLLAFKESLGNALKHTFSEHVLIRFEAGPKNNILIFVQNSFSERKTDVPSSGRGLAGIEERMTRINGNVQVQEEENVFRIWLRVGDK